jgi:hypothetical protein
LFEVRSGAGPGNKRQEGEPVSPDGALACHNIARA